jgi:hypothetical protein
MNIERWWAAAQDYAQHLIHDPQVQGIAGTLAAFSFILYLLVRDS